ncbi:PREDICTED: venom acid phosphatase Acph-1-like [Ceratosolen solmsi marchali]|uniref:acid phosphatase n=1 Tax=Ceratosolen solmsi marchali TaxID=326594 RepID=A0AAJ6YKM7_9HYME|nr:PREDICTED: venom acid phosphatase Acph-1-like [Ceratosolen solmsi marchali]
MAVPNGFNLELIQVLFRHGARSCSKTEATRMSAEHIDQSFQEAVGDAQLTNYGKSQAYGLGCALRDRYAGFLGAGYRPEDVYARSSDYDRTKMSLQLVLAGLYPPIGHQIWNSELNWMPIPYDYKPIMEDILLVPFFNKRYQQHLSEAFNSATVQEKLKKIQELSNLLFESGIITEKKSISLINALVIFNVSYIYKAQNATLPRWCSQNIYDVLKGVYSDYLDIMSMTLEEKKSSGGILIKEFLENFDADDQKTNKKKMYLYSGHDFTLASFINAHTLQYSEYPKFSSAVILEKLRDTQNKLYVRILIYNGKEFTTLKLWNHGDLCTINEYLKAVKNVIPTDDDIDSMINAGTADFLNVLLNK